MSQVLEPEFPVRNHSWVDGEERRISACESPDGCDRTEKTCAACGLVKITIHFRLGIPGRAWRVDSGEVWVGGSTPPCIPKVASASAPAEVPFS